MLVKGLLARASLLVGWRLARTSYLVCWLFARAITVAVIGDFWGAGFMLAAPASSEQGDKQQTIHGSLVGAGVYNQSIQRQPTPLSDAR